MTYRLVVAPSAKRQLDRLPEKVAVAVIEFLSVVEERPEVVGKPLSPPFENNRSARRGAYRIIYSVEGEQVRVHRIEHRSTAYRAP